MNEKLSVIVAVNITIFTVTTMREPLVNYVITAQTVYLSVYYLWTAETRMKPAQETTRLLNTWMESLHYDGLI